MLPATTMTIAPLATLAPDDPLYALLAGEVWAHQLGITTTPIFDVYKLDPSSTAYRYADQVSGAAVVGKFFGNKWIDGAQDGNMSLRIELMEREFANLLHVRTLGFDSGQYQVVRPLAMAATINCVLIEDAVPGDDLVSTIHAAVYENAGALLRTRLRLLAGWLAALHRRSAIAKPVVPEHAFAYYDKMLNQLRGWEVIDADQQLRFERLRDDWAASGLLGDAQQALVHGDATPAHFLFQGSQVTAIDLERMHTADPAADLGCVAAELRHLLSWLKGDTWAGEPYIRHFYASYAAEVGLGKADFAALTERCRFYMGCTELRICRNSWLDLDYRRAFLAEAEHCLAL